MKSTLGLAASKDVAARLGGLALKETMVLLTLVNRGLVSSFRGKAAGGNRKDCRSRHGKSSRSLHERRGHAGHSTSDGRKKRSSNREH